MAVYLINGPSGSGKTTLGFELQRRGYQVINTDEVFGYYANLQTEEEVEFPGTKHATPDWYKVHGWIWNIEKVRKAIHASDTVFFCGGALNESQFYSDFAKIFRLHLSREDLLARLKARDNDQHTNNPVFIKRMLDFLSHSEHDAKQLGMIIINTSVSSIKEAADEIISEVTPL